MSVSVHLDLIKLKSVLKEWRRLSVGTEIRRGKQRYEERRDREEGQGNPHRLLDSLIHANTFFFFVGVKDKRGGERSTRREMTQAGQTGRQAEEGGKWRENGGKESKKELHCLVLI